MFNKQEIPIVYWDLKGNFHLALTFNTIRHTIWSIVLIPCTYDHIHLIKAFRFLAVFLALNIT